MSEKTKCESKDFCRLVKIKCREQMYNIHHRKSRRITGLYLYRRHLRQVDATIGLHIDVQLGLIEAGTYCMTKNVGAR
jgi:hypothetical protein